jgi:hypothetical protein
MDNQNANIWDNSEWTMDDIGKLKSVVAPHRVCISLNNTTQDIDLPAKLTTYFYASIKGSAKLFRFAPVFGVFSPLIDAPDMEVCVGIIDYRTIEPRLFVEQVFDGDGSHFFCLEMPHSVHVKNYDQVKMRFQIRNSNFREGMIGAQLTIFFNIDYGNQNRNYELLNIPPKRIQKLPPTTLANFEILREIIAATVGKGKKVLEAERKARMIDMFESLNNSDDTITGFHPSYNRQSNPATQRSIVRQRTISNGDINQTRRQIGNNTWSDKEFPNMEIHPTVDGLIKGQRTEDLINNPSPWNSAILNPKHRVTMESEDDNESPVSVLKEDRLIRASGNDIVYPPRPRYVGTDED